MSCCSHCEDAGTRFNQGKAREELRDYRKSGPPNKSTQLLIDALKTLDLQDRRPLDVEGGVGMIPFELLEGGMSEAMMVEASPAYLEGAENEDRRRGHDEQTAFEYGDFVDLVPNLPEADLVTLDRVFCCYPNLEELVEASTAKATRWYGVAYPKERWYNKALEKMAAVYCWCWVRHVIFGCTCTPGSTRRFARRASCRSTRWAPQSGGWRSTSGRTEALPDQRVQKKNALV